VLPNNRIQIVYFYVAVVFSLFLWRMFYQSFLASNRFEKKALLVCEINQVEELIKGLQNIDPHYKILGFLKTDESREVLEVETNIKNISVDELEVFVKEKGISEIVIATEKTDAITVDLYNKLLNLLESGFMIREYTQVYESLTQRIPVQYVAKDFYRYFPFSRSNQNRLYLFVVRLLELIFSVIGIFIGVLLLPFILVGNAFGNKGSLLYFQNRVGRNGKVFRILKFRPMVKNAEQNGAVFATTHDVRITTFGKFFRKS
jgi:hypothetical protein